jgi:hypothetical protein
MPFGNSLIEFQPKSGCVASPLDGAGKPHLPRPVTAGAGPHVVTPRRTRRVRRGFRLRGESRRSQGSPTQPDSGRFSGYAEFPKGVTAKPPLSQCESTPRREDRARLYQRALDCGRTSPFRLYLTGPNWPRNSMLDETAPRDLACIDTRLRSIEARLAELARMMEPLPDIRRATSDAADPELALDETMLLLQSLTQQMHQREHVREWDRVDHLTARLMLRALTCVAIELRRRLTAARALLEDASIHALRARQALESPEFTRESGGPSPAIQG